MANQQMLLTRIPADTKSQLKHFCLNNGIKMNYFVADAIKDKLIKIAGDDSINNKKGREKK